MAIIEAIAAAEDATPMELDPLSDEIDLESIDRLLKERSDTSTSAKLIQFSVVGWKVFVRGDGSIRVCDPDRPAEPEPVFEMAISD